MAEKETAPKKKQITLAEYMKIKDKVAHSRLKLAFPLSVKIAIMVPGIILLIMLLFIVFNLSNSNY